MKWNLCDHETPSQGESVVGWIESPFGSWFEMVRWSPRSGWRVTRVPQWSNHVTHWARIEGPEGGE